MEVIVAPVMMATLVMVINVKKLTNVRLELMNATKKQFVSTLPVFINANAVMDFMEMVDFAKMLKKYRLKNGKFFAEENEPSKIALSNGCPTILQLNKLK